MHHKRGRPSNARAGCKMCKPWKANGAKEPANTGSELRRLQPEEPPQHRRKGSRRRWCRGRPGIEHRPVCLTWEQVGKSLHLGMNHRLALKRSRYPFGEWYLVCSECGKELDHYTECPLREERPDYRPDWVVDPPTYPV